MPKIICRRLVSENYLSDYDCAALVVDTATGNTTGKISSLGLSMDSFVEDEDKITYLNLNSNPEKILDTTEPLDLCCPKHREIANLTEWIEK